jgi:hypothetical protein
MDDADVYVQLSCRERRTVQEYHVICHSHLEEVSDIHGLGLADN